METKIEKLQAELARMQARAKELNQQVSIDQASVEQVLAKVGALVLDGASVERASSELANVEHKAAIGTAALSTLYSRIEAKQQEIIEAQKLEAAARMDQLNKDADQLTLKILKGLLAGKADWERLDSVHSERRSLWSQYQLDIAGNEIDLRLCFIEAKNTMDNLYHHNPELYQRVTSK